LEEDINNVARWCCANSLLLNTAKTKSLLLGTPQLLSIFSECITLNFLGKRLHPIFTAKDLGVVLDSHLKYDTHISELVSSCLSKLCQINRIRHLLDREILSYVRGGITSIISVYIIISDIIVKYVVVNVLIFLNLNLHFMSL
jgi:hypothetical protein